MLWNTDAVPRPSAKHFAESTSYRACLNTNRKQRVEPIFYGIAA